MENLQTSFLAKCSIQCKIKLSIYEVFVIYEIIKVEVHVSIISQSWRLRQITLTETLIIQKSQKPNLIIIV